MKNKYLFFLISLFLLKTTTGQCTTYTISADGSHFLFSPDSINVNAGDTLHFALNIIHSALEVDSLTWAANGNTALSGGFHIPFGGGDTVLTAGVHYYVCEHHYNLGMKGRIFVHPLGTGISPINNTIPELRTLPNPVSSGTTIKTNLPSGKENQLKVFDISGKCVYEQKNISPLQYLDLSALSSGIYFVELKAGEVYLEKKLIVSK